MRRSFDLALLCVALVLLANTVALPAFAASIIHVPAEQPTIQAGINAAANGDTVLVSPGTYFENINFNGRNITVTSANGPGITTIDGSKLFTPTVTFSTNESSKAVISGFTIQNGDSSEVSISNAFPTVRGNIILGSTSGIAVQSGSAYVQGNLIAGQYTGISVDSDTNMNILGNLVADNTNVGIDVVFSGGPDVIQQNTIVGNVRGGIFYYSPYSSVLLAQNLISGSQSAGLEWQGLGTSFVVVSNTIANNGPGCCGTSASEIQGYPINGSLTMQNNLLVATGAWPAFDCTVAASAAAFTNNDVFSAGSSPYTSQCPDLTGTNGNIAADPFFVDLLSDDFHLQSTSPARKGGTISAPNEPKQDFDGDARVMSNTIDIGADEYSTKTTQAVSSHSLHYAAQDVGTSSSPQTITLSNGGKTPIAINLIATGPSFSQTNNCGSSLPASASCQVLVRFSPLVGGAINGILGIFTGATLNPEAISLVGTGLAPQIQISCCFSFYNQPVGTTGTQTQTISNPSQAPLLIGSITYSGPSDFVESNNCPISPNGLPAGSSCTLTVSYTPTIAGSETGTITVTSNAGGPQIVYVSGSSVSAGIPMLAPTSLTFPTTLIGQSSAPQTITLSNTGSGPFAITQIYSSSDFSQTNNCPTSLAVGASCTFTVVYTAGVQGAEIGNLYIYTDSSVSWVSASFTGTGTAPVPTISSLSLANAPVGANDSLVLITGTGFINVSQVLWNGQPLNYCCVSVLGSTQILLTIPSTDLLSRGTNQVTVSTAGPGGGTSNAVPFTVFVPVNYASKVTAYNYRNFTGTNLNLSPGLAAVLTSPFPIQFGGGSYTTFTVGASGTISFTSFGNEFNSTIPTSLTTTLVAPFWTDLYPFGTGKDNNVFWQVLGTAPNRQLVVEWRNVGICCETTNTVKFEVVFSEGHSNVLFNYANTVFGGAYSSNDNGATASVGEQVDPNLGTQFSYYQPALQSKTSILWYPNNPTATLSTSSIGFGYHHIGTSTLAQSLRLTNGGLVPLNISSLVIDNPDFTQTNNCGTSLAPNHSCSIRVVFKPSLPYAETGTLTLTDNASNSPQTVSLTGIGTITPTVVYPILVNFGGVAVGNTGTVPVTLANASNHVLTIQQIKTVPSVYTETNTCGSLLAPGASCTVNVAFAPAKKGSVQGTLSMALNGKASVVESKLTGSGQ